MSRLLGETQTATRLGNTPVPTATELFRSGLSNPCFFIIIDSEAKVIMPCSHHIRPLLHHISLLAKNCSNTFIFAFNSSRRKSEVRLVQNSKRPTGTETAVSAYYDVFPPTSTNVSIQPRPPKSNTSGPQKVLVLNKDVSAGEIIYKARQFSKAGVAIKLP